MNQRKGIKLNNSNSTLKPPSVPPEVLLEKSASEAVSRMESYKKQSMDLGAKFKSLVQDQVLPENKSPLTTGLEQEVLSKLVELASAINADEAQPEGLGSVILSQLLMKMMLLQRDTINTLNYRIHLLEKKSTKGE